MNVAIKKALKPFSTPTHCKRTYRELALLKHMHHENVRQRSARCLGRTAQPHGRR